ncbi:MAG: TetR/AcrR family transcriptional regulator [Hyphomicrobiaceae bacterium]
MTKSKTVVPERPSTSDQILDAAEVLVQKGGFNAFSYADISTAVGVSKATIHHHFPAKAVLGRCLIKRYSDRFFGMLSDLTRETASPLRRLRTYISIHAALVQSDKLCLCGMLAAELPTLTGAMRTELEDFFQKNIAWVASTVSDARSSGEAAFNQDPAQLGRLIIAGLDGLMILARTQSSSATFEADAWELLSRIISTHPSNRPTG